MDIAPGNPWNRFTRLLSFSFIFWFRVRTMDDLSTFHFIPSHSIDVGLQCIHPLMLISKPTLELELISEQENKMCIVFRYLFLFLFSISVFFSSLLIIISSRFSTNALLFPTLLSASLFALLLVIYGPMHLGPVPVICHSLRTNRTYIFQRSSLDLV